MLQGQVDSCMRFLKGTIFFEFLSLKGSEKDNPIYTSTFSQWIEAQWLDFTVAFYPPDLMYSFIILSRERSS